MKQQAINIIFVNVLTVFILKSVFAYDYTQLKFKECTSKNNYLDEPPSYKLSTTLDKYYLGSSDYDQKLKSELKGKVCEQCFINSKSLMGTNVDQAISEIQKILMTPKAEDLRCVQYAQENSGGATWWTNCTTNTTNINKEAGAKKKIKPCVSRAYTELTTRAFLQVTDCLGINKREFFTYLLQESGLNLNPRSPTGVGSIGQLTSGAISGVRDMQKNADLYKSLKLKEQNLQKTGIIDSKVKSELDYVKVQIKYWDDIPKAKGYIQQSIEFDKNINNNKGACSLVSQVDRLKLTDKEAAIGCQLESFPRNPIAPLLISAKYFNLLKAQVVSVLTDEKLKNYASYKNFSKFLEKLKPSEKAEVWTMLTSVGYNAGLAGALQAVKTFFLIKRIPEIKTLSGFLSQFELHLKSEIPRIYAEAMGSDKSLSTVKKTSDNNFYDKGIEASRYYSSSKAKLDNVDKFMKKEGGFSCFSE